MLAHPAWPDPTQTHQSRSSMPLSNRRNSQLGSKPSTTTRERGIRGTLGRRAGKKDGGREPGEPGWDQAERSAKEVGKVRRKHERRGKGLGGGGGKQKPEGGIEVRYRSIVTQRC